MGSICLLYGLCLLCDSPGATQELASVSAMVLRGIRLQHMPGWILISGNWLGRGAGQGGSRAGALAGGSRLGDA